MLVLATLIVAATAVALFFIHRRFPTMSITQDYQTVAADVTAATARVAAFVASETAKIADPLNAQIASLTAERDQLKQDAADNLGAMQSAAAGLDAAIPAVADPAPAAIDPATGLPVQ